MKVASVSPIHPRSYTNTTASIFQGLNKCQTDGRRYLCKERDLRRSPIILKPLRRNTRIILYRPNTAGISSTSCNSKFPNKKYGDLALRIHPPPIPRGALLPSPNFASKTPLGIAGENFFHRRNAPPRASSFVCLLLLTRDEISPPTTNERQEEAEASFLIATTTPFCTEGG